MSAETPSDVDPFAPPTAALERPADPPVQEALPIGGWLIVVGLGLVIAGIQLVRAFYRDLSWALGPEGQIALSHTPTMIGVVIAFALSAALAVYAVLVFSLFVMRSRRTPRLYIGFHLAILAQIVITSSLRSMEPEQVGALVGRAAIPAAIWIPYFLMSKRVARTFVR
jgi:hypothetical protein